MTAPDPRHPLFRAIAGELGVALATQPEGDLGARMMAALAAARGPAIVVGTDGPALTPEHLRAAAQALAEGIDVVIIPVDDGGYGLIGMQRLQPALLEGMTWSTSSVMRARDSPN